MRCWCTRLSKVYSYATSEMAIKDERGRRHSSGRLGRTLGVTAVWSLTTVERKLQLRREEEETTLSYNERLRYACTAQKKGPRLAGARHLNSPLSSRHKYPGDIWP